MENVRKNYLVRISLDMDMDPEKTHPGKAWGVNLRVMTHDNSMIIRFSELVGLRSCDKSGQITVLPKLELSGFGGIPDSLNHHFFLGDCGRKKLQRLIDKLWDYVSFRECITLPRNIGD